ncbi:MAG: hypothetical protein N2053_13355, partial [Chitinispirillaceae bacterium]|nr:hypothetical protein [Chitinispirillaceae bacterium]
MTYQLSNRRDRRTFDIAPALEMLEKFVEKKRKEKELEKVTNLLSQSFSNLNNPDELVKVNTEIVNKILTDPELGQDTKNYGLQLANVYSNLKSKELEYNMKKELSQLGGSILKEREFLYPTLEGLTVKKGEEIFNEYKSKYPNIPDETLWSVIEKG